MTEIYVRDFIVFLFVFLRIFAAFIAAPILGNKAIPVIAQIFIGMVIAYILFYTIDKNAIEVELNLWFIASFGIKEILTGLTLGFMLQMVFYGISFAGTLIGYDIGLMMAQTLNPLEEANNNVIGEAIYFSAMIIFLIIDGHHYVIEGLVYSFKVVPIGKYIFTQDLFAVIVKYSAQVFVIAVKIASPIIVSFFLLHLAEGIIARVIPQMQVFFVTQPLKIGIGLALLGLSAPVYIYVLKNLLKSYENGLLEIIGAMN